MKINTVNKKHFFKDAIRKFSQNSKKNPKNPLGVLYKLQTKQKKN